MTQGTRDPIVLAAERAFLQGASGVLQPAWLAQRRAYAMQHFVELGLPKRTDEAWRFTDLRPLIATGGLPLPVPEGSVGVETGGHSVCGTTHRIVLVNGRFSAEESRIGALPNGVWLGSLTQAIAERPDLVDAAFGAADMVAAQPFASLNGALFTDGFILALDGDVVLPDPVEILHISDAPGTQACHERNAILAGPGSAASVVETYAASPTSWSNSVTTVDVGPNAALRHVKLQADDPAAIHIALTRARLAESSLYDVFLLITGGRLSRQDVQVAIAGEAANLVLNAAYLLDGEQEATIAALVDHQAPDGQTRELLKGVVGGHAHGIFLGTVIVREGADGTDARQLNRNLMMSPTARVDTKPELTIYADEVKCSHGATVGDLDEAALFYLESRGIDPVTARQMLVAAFATEALDTAALEPAIDTHARRYLQAWIDNRHGGLS